MLESTRVVQCSIGLFFRNSTCSASLLREATFHCDLCTRRILEYRCPPYHFQTNDREILLYVLKY